MMKNLFFILLAFAVIDVFAACEWVNIDEAHHRGGRKLSAGYLQGKAVLVCKDPAMSEEMENIWESYANKQFQLIGAFKKAPEETTFSVYEGADLDGAPSSPIYIVDAAGKIRYKGKQTQNAIQALVMALTDSDAPKNAAELRRFFDFEYANLPAHALLRLMKLKKSDPAKAKPYLEKEKELLKLAEIKKVAELVEYARKIRDPQLFGAKDKAKRMKFEREVKAVATSQKYLSLKEAVQDERLKQEVKNSIADIKIAAASF